MIHDVRGQRDLVTLISETGMIQNRLRDLQDVCDLGAEGCLLTLRGWKGMLVKHGYQASLMNKL